MRRLLSAALAIILCLPALPALAQSEPGPGDLSVELNKLEAGDAGGCRAYFLFRNRSAIPLEAFEMSLAVLNSGGVIDRLLTIDAAPLAASRTTLKLFEIPQIGCADVSEIIVHDIPSCRSQNDEVQVDCFAILELKSLADAALVN